MSGYSAVVESAREFQMEKYNVPPEVDGKVAQQSEPIHMSQLDALADVLHPSVLKRAKEHQQRYEETTRKLRRSE